MPIGPRPFEDDDEDEEDEEQLLPPEPVRRRFWAIVVLLNLGLFAVSLGVMIAAFRGEFQYAALLVAGGLVVLYSAYRRYRSRHEVFEQDE